MNPYQENVDIVKGFFKKKTVLFYAIFSILPIFSLLFIKIDVLIDTVRKISDNQFVLRDIEHQLNLSGILTSTYILFIFEILIAVVFLLFFVKAGNDDDSLKAPIGMFQVVSLIELIVTAFVSLALILVIFIFSLYSLANFSTLTSIMFIPFMFAVIPIMLIMLFAQTLFSLTVKNSVNSIYLKKTGAKLYGIMNILLAALCIYFGGLIVIHGLSKTTEVIPLLVFLGLTAVKYAFGAAVGIGYCEYIKGFSDSSTAREESEDAVLCKNCGHPLNPDDYFCNHCGATVEK